MIYALFRGIMTSYILFVLKQECEFHFGDQKDSEQAYRNDCMRMTAQERLACIQQLRIVFWGDEASTGRLSRVPDFVKRSQG